MYTPAQTVNKHT